ncbi:MAG: ABC transporter permease [Solobacterium sp.]|nr:ABC transporter permease [Solobacterium sp.]
MNAFQRAYRYITRKPTKSMLLMITFFLIGNLVILGLGISQAADNAKILTRQQMRAAVSYEVDYEAYWRYTESLTDEDEINNAYQNYPRTSRETALKLTEDNRVKAFNYMTNTIAYSRDFENVPLGNEENRGNSTYIDENGNEQVYRDPNVMIYATMFPNMIEIAEGTFTIIEGSFISQNDIDQGRNVVNITKELADMNNLHAGDTITVSTIGPYEVDMYREMGFTEEDFSWEMEISGIYSTLNEVDPNSQEFQWMSPYQSPKNIILVPMTTYSEVMSSFAEKQFRYYQSMNPEMTDDEMENWTSGYTDPSRVVYLLSDPMDVEDFIADHEGDLSPYTKLNANNETFKKLARPLDTLSFFSNIVVWIVIINAIVIITLVTALTLKTREYEIGVMLSIGVSKIKVVLQLFLELILIALIGFTLAVGSGSLLAGKVGDMVLDYQTTSDAQYEDNSDSGYYWSSDANYFTEVSQDELLSQYHVSVSPKLIGEIYLLGSAVVLIAIVIPSFMIMRLNPKQILLEQN